MPDFGATIADVDATGFTSNDIAGAANLGAISSAVLESLSVYKGSAPDATFRLALYSGGTSDTDPDGASLIADSGEFLASGSAGWYTALISGSPAIPESTRLFLVGRQSTYSRTSDQPADMLSRLQISGHTGNQDTSAAFPATMNNTSVTLNSTGAYLVYLTYRVDTGERFRVYF